MNLREDQKTAMFTYGIPEYMHGAIIRYYENGISPGDFLTAIIDNDLKEAVGRADDQNIDCLKSYVMWFYNKAPGGSWGYTGAVDKWIASFGSENMSGQSKALS